MDETIHSQFDLAPGQCTYDPITFNPGTPNEWGIGNRYVLHFKIMFFIGHMSPYVRFSTVRDLLFDIQ